MPKTGSVRTAMGGRKLTEEEAEAVDLRVREWMYSGDKSGYMTVLRRISEELNIPLHASQIQNSVERIRKFDAKAERARKHLPIDDVRGEHRARRELILHASLQAGKYLEANKAADALMALDGIAPELVKIERDVKQMPDDELQRFLGKLLDAQMLGFLAGCLTAGQAFQLAQQLPVDIQHALIEGAAGGDREVRNRLLGGAPATEGPGVADVDGSL